MSSVREYEVTVTVRNLQSREERLLTVTEYAYGAQDVVYQACHNIPSQLHGEEIVKLNKIGPPQRLVELASKELAEEILRAAKALSRTS